MRALDCVIHPPLTEIAVPFERQALDDDASRAEALTSLLAEPESSRIALYLPEAWLPRSDDHAYREAYMDAWWNLLGHVDQRADFVDGDIGERNLCDSTFHLPSVILTLSTYSDYSLCK